MFRHVLRGKALWVTCMKNFLRDIGPRGAGSSIISFGNTVMEKRSGEDGYSAF